MMKKNLLAALCLLAPLSAQAEPIAESLTYRAFIGGLPLGDLKLKIAMDETRYATEARFDMVSLLRWVLDNDARASASGRLESGATIPASFDYWLRDGKKERNTEMRFDAAGNPVNVDADPEFDLRSYDITLDKARGALDPATAVVMLSAPRAAACDLDFKVFDGRKLHRITMEPASGSAEKPRCKGRYTRLAGFKKKYMSPERRSYPFEAELQRIAPNRWRPRRVWAKTKYGSAVAVLR